MKVIECCTMPDGTKIQLEDWREDNTTEYPNLYGFIIGAYPIAKNTGKYCRWIERGKKFRVSISYNEYANYSNEDVKADYEALKTGSKKVEDLSKHFWNGQKDMWYLGMNVENKGY